MADARDSVEDLPIDIAYNKLADWLVDRRKVPRDWRKKLATVHAKVAAALSTLPRSVDPSFANLTPDCTGYLEAKHVRDVLSKLPESRNMFGRTTGAAGEWDGIVSAYEKDLIFLGEAAQILVQSTNYDIPFQKRQLAKLQQQLADSERKQSELKRNAAQSATKYQQACQELGIPGTDVKTELLSLGKTLPNIFRDVLDGICGGVIGSALEYYQAFSAYAHAVQGDDSTPVLLTLSGLRDNPPDVHAELNHTRSCGVQLEHREDTQPEDQNDVGIDWGIGTEDTDSGIPDGQNDIGIDWGVGTEDTNPGMTADIDWDIGTVEEADPSSQSTGVLGPDGQQNLGNEANDERKGGSGEDAQPSSEINWDVDAPAEIDWDIDMEEAGVLPAPESPHIADQQSSDEGIKAAKASDVQASWFAKAENRNRLLDDLFELKVFLKQRLQELDNDETSALQNQVQVVAPASIPQHGSEALMSMASSISKALNLFTNRTTRELILISTSMRYLDRLEASLIHKRQIGLNLQHNIADLSTKRLELRNGQALLWPKQDALVARTLAFKFLVESTLSAQYNGRTVNIIGEINTLLGLA